MHIPGPSHVRVNDTPASIGVDVGGTYVRGALVGEGGDVLQWRITRTPDHLSAFVGVLVDMLGPWVAAAGDGGLPLGVALPGILDEERRFVVRSLHAPFLERAPIIDRLAEALRTRAVLLTDADAATWAEYTACRPAPSRFVHLRFGTGIGCGVLHDGRFIRHGVGRTGHLPLLVFDRSAGAPACPCGLKGCLETVAGGAALSRQAQGLRLGGSLCELEAACSSGNEAACGLVDRVARSIMRVLGGIVQSCKPRAICLGGGVLEHLPSLERAVRSCWVAQTETLFDAGPCMLRPPCLGQQAGAVGAARLARRNLPTS